MKRRTRLVDDERITTYGLLHEAHGRLSQAFERTFLSRLGIGSAVYEVLLRIGRSPDGHLSVSELGRQLAITTGGATRVVDRAEAAGLVERQPCSGDRRIQYVALTPSGRRLLERATRLHLRDLQAELVDRLTPDELAALRRITHKLRRADRGQRAEDRGAMPAGA